jgi:hypothetical protein
MDRPLYSKEEVTVFTIQMIVVCSLFAVAIYWAWVITGNSLQEATKADAVPFVKANAVITSKDGDDKLSIKSSTLPKGGDVIGVDRYAYGATSIGDSVCVRYKRLPDEPQHGTEFVSQGSCK